MRIVTAEGSHETTAGSSSFIGSKVLDAAGSLTADNPASAPPGGPREPARLSAEPQGPVSSLGQGECLAGLHHSYRYAGHGDPSDKCDRPRRLVCITCSNVIDQRCGSTRASRCEPCGESHRRRVATIVHSGISADRPSGLWFVTLTAPGADVLEWDESKCSHESTQPCSGALGCTVERVAAAEWNARAPRAWSWMVTYLRRALRTDVEFCGTWEVQRRGVLHRHCVFRAVGVADRRFRAAVRLAAFRWGFGRQIDVQGLSAHHAWYLAKYASKTSDEMSQCAWLDKSTGELVAARYRPWSSSRSWGDSMAVVKAAQRAWAHQVRGTSTGGTRPAGGAAGVALEHNSNISTDALPEISNAPRVSTEVDTV